MSIQRSNIRSEVSPADADAIDFVHLRAFGGPLEGRIVRALRAEGVLVLSLVAECEGTIVGHIAFSPVTVPAQPAMRGVGLGPVGVLPAQQGQGIGKQLIRAGLKACRELGEFGFAVVLGSQAYYRQFGFVRAIDRGLRCEFGPEAEDHFGILPLHCGAIPEGAGTIRYHVAFNPHDDSDDVS